MIGAYTIGKKAVKFGYKRYGVPGAVATGGAVLAGYVAVKRALKSSSNGENADSDVDMDVVASSADDETGEMTGEESDDGATTVGR